MKIEIGKGLMSHDEIGGNCRNMDQVKMDNVIKHRHSPENLDGFPSSKGYLFNPGQKDEHRTQGHQGVHQRYRVFCAIHETEKSMQRIFLDFPGSGISIPIDCPCYEEHQRGGYSNGHQQLLPADRIEFTEIPLTHAVPHQHDSQPREKWLANQEHLSRGNL